MIKRQISFLFEDPGFCIDVFCTIAEPVRYYNRDTESGAWYSSTPDWNENGSLIREDLIFEVIANGVVCALDGNGNFEGKKPFVPFYQFRQSLVQSVHAQYPHLQDHEALNRRGIIAGKISLVPYFLGVPPITTPPNRFNVIVQCMCSKFSAYFPNMLHNCIAVSVPIQAPHKLINSLTVKNLSCIEG